jgi:hypothetical protein
MERNAETVPGTGRVLPAKDNPVFDEDNPIFTYVADRQELEALNLRTLVVERKLVEKRIEEVDLLHVAEWRAGN